MSKKDVEHFAKFAAKELGIKKMPKIHYVGHSHDSRNSFGDFEPHDDVIKVRTVDRHPVDVMRTVAHELSHYKWKEEGKSANNKAGDESENYANAKAGEIMRHYDDTHGFAFKEKPLKEDGVAPAAVNATGPAVAGTGGGPGNVPGNDVTWKKKKKLSDIMTRKTLGDIRGSK